MSKFVGLNKENMLKTKPRVCSLMAPCVIYVERLYLVGAKTNLQASVGLCGRKSKHRTPEIEKLHDREEAQR